MDFSYVDKGIPNVLALENCKTHSLACELVPEADEIVRNYESQGGRITRFSPFGNDPLIQSARADGRACKTALIWP